MTPFPTFLDRLDRWLTAHRPEYHACLRRGVTDVTLDEFEARFGLTLPPEFRQLYLWRDGQTDGNYQSLQMNWMFVPLAVSAESKAMCDDMIGFDFESPDWWRTDWVPLLANGGGDHLCLDLGGFGGGRPGQLLTFRHDDPDRPIESPHPTAWLEDLVTSAEAGTLEVL